MAHDPSLRRRRTAVSFVTVAACLLSPVPAARAAVDLTGWWRIDMPATPPPANLVHVTQTANTVTIPVSPPLSGSVNGPSLSGGPPVTEYDFRLTPAADVIDGRRISFSGTPPNLTFLGIDRLLLVRCSCNDGNTTDGDGCGADCQVEPCYACTGDPSVCTPSPDGAPCDDRHDCTTGETCSAGACGGGSAITPCIDLTGTLERHILVPGLLDQTGPVNVVQRNGTFFLDSYVGSVDQAASTVRLTSPITDINFGACLPDVFNFFDGRAGPVGFSASGHIDAATLQCVHFAATLTAVRTTCGDGTVQLPERCDDGNRSPGDGCSEFCGIEVCQLRSSCAHSTKPQSTLLQIRNTADDAKDTVTWKWTKGDATPVSIFGDPVTSDDYALCVFDESSATPALLFDATAPAGGTCAGKPCWKANKDKGFAYRDKEATPDGLTGVTLKAGTAGKAAATVAGKGALLSSRPRGLPGLPLPLPLRVQLQGANGACFEDSYGPDGVVQNDPATGRFKAHGGS